MRYFGLLLFALLAISCERGYYNTTETYVDEEESRELIHGLKEGTLIVQIPYEEKKINILKSIYEKESDPEKRKKLKQKHDKFVGEMQQNQQSLVAGILNYYKFSKYAFVPDTLIKEFKKGRRDNIFLKNDLTLGKEVEIDDSKTILFLRDHRDYDNLYIHKFNGDYPPNPFPYSTQLPTTVKSRVNFIELTNLRKYNSISHAIYIMDRKLKRFFNEN